MRGGGEGKRVREEAETGGKEEMYEEEEGGQEKMEREKRKVGSWQKVGVMEGKVFNNDDINAIQCHVHPKGSPDTQ